MFQNYHLFHVSNLFVVNFPFFSGHVSEVSVDALFDLGFDLGLESEKYLSVLRAARHGSSDTAGVMRYPAEVQTSLGDRSCRSYLTQHLGVHAVALPAIWPVFWSADEGSWEAEGKPEEARLQR